MCVLVLWVDSVVTGLFLFIGSITQQTSQLSSYEVTVPRRIGRYRRDQDSADKVNNLTKHKSYLTLTVWIGSSACPSHSLKILASFFYFSWPINDFVLISIYTSGASKIMPQEPSGRHTCPAGLLITQNNFLKSLIGHGKKRRGCIEN